MSTQAQAPTASTDNHHRTEAMPGSPLQSFGAVQRHFGLHAPPVNDPASGSPLQSFEVLQRHF
eukprot:3808988-Rhodomonas_salina.1